MPEPTYPPRADNRMWQEFLKHVRSRTYKMTDWEMRRGWEFWIEGAAAEIRINAEVAAILNRPVQPKDKRP